MTKTPSPEERAQVIRQFLRKDGDDLLITGGRFKELEGAIASEIRAAVEAEREACAMLITDAATIKYYHSDRPTTPASVCDAAARAIRARKETP